MKRLIGSLVFAASGLALAVAPARAATTGAQHDHTVVDWKKRDTAVYVVSTINLLRATNGRPALNTLQNKVEVIRYNVFADTSASNLYFISLRRLDGTTAAVLAYQMGWVTPRLVSGSLAGLSVTPAPDIVVRAYQSDPKQQIGIFSSTIPQQ